MSGKWILRFFTFLAFSNCCYAQVTHPAPQAYAALSAGYGKFQNTSNGSGDTPVARLAIGSLWELNQNALLGGEVGIQSGNRMQLSNDVAAAFGYTSTPPLFLTVKLPVDILAVLKYHFAAPVFVQVKAGAVYLRTMTDSPDITSESTVMPEVQVGAGYDLTCRTRVVLSYQQFFGQTPGLRNINPATGTANLKHVPSWQAGMISFETDF